ncbi:MAG: DNA methyltransferase [Verrucomicrobiales bacterium]|nr:DNA methyltransferase [Verrucomicrobiales bacterium]
MGSKYRLLEWIHSTLESLQFSSAVDAFCGSGAVSYLLKSMGASVIANDSLSFPSVLATALIENDNQKIDADELDLLLSSKARKSSEKFIQKTFSGIFYTPEDLEFLDNVWSGIRAFDCKFRSSLAISALLRSAVKRQPRGQFTVAGDPERYKDGRRDLQLSLKEHFIEQIQIYNSAVFTNQYSNKAISGDATEVPKGADLVYLDPPYVPRSDDNCYVKRYHFLEGLSCYWEGKEILADSKVKKIAKPFTPFSYRRTADEAFANLFRHFSDSTLVLSYSSNAYPDLKTLVSGMKKYKKSVDVVTREHRYHFGTHKNANRNEVTEYLIIGH